MHMTIIFKHLYLRNSLLVNQSQILCAALMEVGASIYKYGLGHTTVLAVMAIYGKNFTIFFLSLEPFFLFFLSLNTAICLADILGSCASLSYRPVNIKR